MQELLEVGMLICFGASWPVNLVKAARAQSTRGASLPFFVLIEVGYLCGIAAKLLSGRINYVIAFYALNFLTVAANIVMYAINRAKERVA